jgi:hypothetical protein
MNYSGLNHTYPLLENENVGSPRGRSWGRCYFCFTSMTYHNVSKKPRQVCMLMTRKSHNVNDLIDNINYDLNIVTHWMENNKLQIHPKKSTCMFIASPYKIKNIPQGIPILINNVPVPRVNCYKCLGVTNSLQHLNTALF